MPNLPGMVALKKTVLDRKKNMLCIRHVRGRPLNLLVSLTV